MKMETTSFSEMSVKQPTDTRRGSPCTLSALEMHHRKRLDTDESVNLMGKQEISK
jgi:hypothetical protein